MTVLVPSTGEVVDLATAASEALAEIFESIADAEQQLRSQKRELIDEIAKRLDQDGRRSLRVSPDLIAEETITERKAAACVRFEPKPVWSELKTLLSDPRCKARIEHCYSEEPHTRSARVVR
jgi:hypothetical protein